MNEIVQSICSHAVVDAIYLYGSRAKNTVHPNSDWDIAVIFTDYEPNELERLVRPQLLEAEVESELKLYQKISIVDLEIVPMYLQMAILNHGIKWFDRNVPRVKRLEHSILSKWEKDYARYCVEQSLSKHQRDMFERLNEYSQQDPEQWTQHDLFAIQRVLQIYIEAFIGIARYLVQQKYQISVSQSREAIDELKKRADISSVQHKHLMKIIGFRNVLVHDYLDVNNAIVEAIIMQRQYSLLDSFISNWQQELARLPV